MRTKSAFRGIFVVAVFFVISLSANAFADEKIGNLVFSAMKKIQENHQSFLDNVKTIRNDRKSAIAERAAIKKKYMNARRNTLDKKEFHARFSYAQAKVYRALYDEARVCNQATKKQLGILNRLRDSIASGEAQIDAGGVVAVAEAAKPFLENGKSLLNSLAQDRDKIIDPVINSRLNAAVDAARMLSQYVKHIEKSRVNRGATQMVLKRKVEELVDQLNSLYVQTDIFMAMIQDKTTVLKMVNELAASEMGILVLSEGKKYVANISTDVMVPLMERYYESDEDLDMITDNVLDNDNQRKIATSGYSQNWTRADF